MVKKIVVFGFYGPDQARISPPTAAEHVSPVSTDAFMRLVREIEPPATRIGSQDEAPCFVKLSGLASQPVYVQSLSDRNAAGAALFHSDGYVAIIDAVKILAPKTITRTLRRLAEQQPGTHLIIAAGRQNEPDALSSEEIREVLGLHPSLPIYPFAPTEPKTVYRLIRRLARYIDDPARVAAPIFPASDEAPADVVTPEPAAAPEPAPAPAMPRIHGLDHVALTVSNLPRSLDFYQGLLGFRLVGHLDFPGDERGFSIAYLDTGRGVLELFSFAHAQTRPSGWQADDLHVGPRHFALRVTNLDAIAEQLMCAGVPFTLEPTDAVGGVRIAFFTDPDGALIELIEGDLTYSRR